MPFALVLPRGAGGLIRSHQARARLRHKVVYPNVTGRAKERKAQIKRAHAGSLAIFDKPQVAGTCILRVDVVFSFPGFTFAFFLFFFFHFSFRRSRGPSFNRSAICMRPGSLTQLPNNRLYLLSVLFVGRCRLFRVLCVIAVSSFVWRYVFFPDGVFLLCGHELDFAISLLCDSPINQSNQ